MVNWIEITQEALIRTWQVIVEFLPSLLAALFVLIFGWVVSEGIGKIVTRTLKKLGLDKVFQRTNWKDTLVKAEIKVEPSEFIGEICKWIGVLTFLIAVVEILQLRGFGEFLEKIISLLANLLVAVVILIAAGVIGDIVGKVVRTATTKIGLKISSLLEMVVKGVIYVFAVFAILSQFQIGGEFVKALIYGIVFSTSLAIGLAFGLGGKDSVAKLLEELKEKLKEK